MDYNKIGKFISTERKIKKLTQAKLAEKLFVSEKTVSKWENGKGVPDTNTLPKLCEIFNVSLNELLSGERIVNENYVNKAEEKLLELQKSKEESNKKFLLLEIVISIITIISFFTIIMSSAYMLKKLNLRTLPILMIISGIIILISGMVCCLIIEQKVGFYVCKKCNHKHIPTFNQVLWAMHINRTRYMKCPMCNKKSWQKKVIK